MITISEFIDKLLSTSALLYPEIIIYQHTININRTGQRVVVNLNGCDWLTISNDGVPFKFVYMYVYNGDAPLLESINLNGYDRDTHTWMIVDDMVDIDNKTIRKLLYSSVMIEIVDVKKSHDGFVTQLKEQFYLP